MTIEENNQLSIDASMSMIENLKNHTEKLNTTTTTEKSSNSSFDLESCYSINQRNRSKSKSIVKSRSVLKSLLILHKHFHKGQYRIKTNQESSLLSSLKLNCYSSTIKRKNTNQKNNKFSECIYRALETSVSSK